VTARDRMVILIVLALAGVAAAWMFVVSPKRHQASALSSQISTQQSQLDSVRSQVIAGETARKEFTGQYQQLAELGEAVPPDDDVPSLIYQLQGAAKATGVSFRSLQLSNSSGNPSNPSSSSSSSSSGSSSASTAAAAAAEAASLPPGAAVGPAGLPAEQFTFTLDGNFFHVSNFFKRIDQFVIDTPGRLSIAGRLMTINAVSLTPGPAGFPQIAANVSATTYIVPATEGPFDGATSAGPAGTAPSAPASALSSSSSSSSGAPAAAISSVVK
jgi:hypothetical protein